MRSAEHSRSFVSPESLPFRLRRDTTTLPQAPHVTVRDFLKNFFYTSVGAQSDVNSHELNVLQMKARGTYFESSTVGVHISCRVVMTVLCHDVEAQGWQWHAKQARTAANYHLRSSNQRSCSLLLSAYFPLIFDLHSGPHMPVCPQVHGLVASYANLAPAKKEAARVIAAAAAAVSAAGEVKHAIAAPRAAPSAAAAAPSAGPAAAAGLADGDSDDDCAVVDAKTSDELYEVRLKCI